MGERGRNGLAESDVAAGGGEEIGVEGVDAGNDVTDVGSSAATATATSAISPNSQLRTPRS